MYRSLFPRDLFAEVDRLQREMQQAFDTVSPSIRGFAAGYPALNVGSTPTSVEIYAFAPGIDPAKVEVHLERGVLTIEGERAPPCAPATKRPRRTSTSASRGASAASSACPTTSTPTARQRQLPRRRAACQRAAPRVGAAAPHRSAMNARSNAMTNQDMTQPARQRRRHARGAGAAAAGGRDRGFDRHHAVCRPARRAEGPAERARRRRELLHRRRAGAGRCRRHAGQPRRGAAHALPPRLHAQPRTRPRQGRAELSQGVLRLRIPKAEHAQPRRIEVQVA